MRSFLVSPILFMLLIFSFATASAQSSMNFTTDLTWASKYMIDGFNVGGDKPVWQLAAKADFYESGFSAMFWTAVQADRLNKQYDEQDFFLLYSHNFFDENRYSLNFHGFYDYWLFPNSQPVTDEFNVVTSNRKKHGNKFQIGFSLPKLFSLGNSYVVPSYNIYKLIYWEQDRADLNRSGVFHELLLEYFRPIKLFIPGATYQYAGATTSLDYYSGAFNVKPGFSHSTASLASGIYALKSIFSLSLNYQWSYEKAVNPTDELWTTFSYVKKF